MNQKTLFERLTSRKFLVALSSAALILFEGTELYTQIATASVAIIYIVSQALVDRSELQRLPAPTEDQ